MIKNRKHKVIITVVAVIALPVGFFGIGAALGHSTHAKTAAAPAPSASAPAPNSAFLAWYNGTGYSDFQAVNSDISQATTDADNGNVIAEENDGAQIATDAQAAADNPMPIDTNQYVAAMNYYVQAGNDASDDDFTDAATELEAGTVNINAVTAVMKGLVNAG
jgi:hypothetical protein